jgi:methyl-accepting chemotaxis protein
MSSSVIESTNRVINEQNFFQEFSVEIIAFIIIFTTLFSFRNKIKTYIIAKSFNFKINFILALFFIPYVVTSSISIFSMKSVSVEIDEIAELNIPVIETLTSSTINLLEQGIAFERYLRLKTDKEFKHFVELGIKVNKTLKQSINYINSHLDKATKEHRVLFLEKTKEISDVKKMHKTYIESVNSLIKINEVNNPDVYLKKVNEIELIQDKVDHKIEALLLSFEKDTEIAALTAEEYEHQAIKMISTIFIFSFIISVIFTFILKKDILFTLNKSVSDLKDNVDKVTKMSVDIKELTNNLSSRTIQQAASLESTASSSTEITQTVSSNANNAKESLDKSEETVSMAHAGKKLLRELDESLIDVNKSTEEFRCKLNKNTERLNEIVDSIKHIEEKTTVINDIVFQTKLLSFNASVEAARAGEHGKGFSVVAEEVGNLATISGNAATEISVLIEESVSKVSKIINESEKEVESQMQINTQKMDSVNGLSQESLKTFESILDRMVNLKAVIQEIAVGSKQQASSVNEVSSNIIEIQDTTTENKELSSSLYDLTTDLNENIDSLRDIFENVENIVEGQKKAS